MPQIVDLDSVLATLPVFVKAHGHGRVPVNCVIDNVHLGEAIADLRYEHRRKRLDPETRARLDAAGIAWSISAADRWTDGIVALTEFVAAHNHADVPSDYQTAHGFCLGQWLHRIKRKHRMGQLPELRTWILLDLGVDFAPKRDDRAGYLHALTKFVEHHGHTRVPAGYVTADGADLGRWLARQQDLYEAGLLRTQLVQPLIEAGMPWQTAFNSQWERGFAAFTAWVAEHGHAGPDRDAVVDGYAVGEWWRRQYKAWQSGKLHADRIHRLESLGASPTPENSSAARWRQSMLRLQDFIRATGHAQVPKTYRSADGYALGRWFQRQRRRYNDGLLSAERIADLEDVGVRLSLPARNGRPRKKVVAAMRRPATPQIRAA